MRVFASALALWATGVANGISSCLDPDHESYQCASGTTKIYLTEEYCGDALTDADVEDVASCFDNAGRASVTLIWMESNGFTTLPAGLFDGFDNLGKLLLSNSLISSLPLGLFDGLRSLYYLTLRENQIASLPTGLFDDLDSLQFLSFSDNQLTWLPAGIFDGLGALRDLFLRDNSLSTLSFDVFDGLESLVQLDLEGNDHLQCLPMLTRSPLLTDDKLILPDGFEDGGICSCPSAGDDGACESDGSCLPGTDGYMCNPGIYSCLDPNHESYQCASGTTKIYLTDEYCGNGLTDADVEDVASCFDNAGRTSVTLIWMESNTFTTLPAGLFDGFDNLGKLILDENLISSLPLGLFDGLRSLYYLTLRENQIASLPTGLFDDLDALQFLSFSDNQLTWLSAGIFDGLGALRDLFLRDNSLSTLSFDVFDGLESLVQLDLEGNDDLQCLPMLTRSPLLTDDKLILPDGFEDGDCSCPSDGDDGACESDESCLPGTDGYICSPGISSCLDPDHESYQCASGTKKIYLTEDYCGDALTDSDVADVASCFDNAGRSSVTLIWMESNTFTSLPAGLFDGFDNLEKLLLSNNLISSIPLGLFDGLPSLYYLTLRENHMGSLPAGLFDDLDALQFLSLTENQLTWLPAGIFDGLGALRDLFLGDNSLSTLRLDVFYGLESLVQLDLEGNDDLQCLPLLTGSPLLMDNDLILPDGIDDGSICSCPSAGDDGACESDESCLPDTDGYICSAARS